jgi:ATP-dependent exoDNAse (exonuclease V) alpha subunit
MASFHLHVKIVRRINGDIVCGFAAYRAGEKIYDYYYGIEHDYTRKLGIVHSEIILPQNAPLKFSERETLWNEVEFCGGRKDSRLAREVVLALPIELNLSEQKKLAKEFIIKHFVDKGMCADLNIHDKGNGNPHAHILLTTRFVLQDGFGIINREWNKNKCRFWRKEWAKAQNQEFERKGLNVRVSHESYAIQDMDKSIKREPQKRLSKTQIMLERSGIQTERGNENRAIEERNRNNELKRQKALERKKSRGQER